MTVENPQPASWSEWRKLKGGGLGRRRIGNFGQDMTEILRPGLHWSTITESFVDAKRFFHTYAGPELSPDEQEFIDMLADKVTRLQLPEMPLEWRVYWDAEGSDSVLFTDQRNYTASVGISNTAEGKSLIVKLGKPEDFDQNEVLDHQADVTLIYRHGRLQSCTIDKSDFLGAVALRFLDEGIVVGWRELRGNIPEEDIDIEDDILGQYHFELARIEAFADRLTGSKYSNKFYRYDEEFFVNSQVMENSLAAGGHLYPIGINRVLTVRRRGNICAVAYKTEGEQQRCIAFFPLEIPQEQVTTILNDPKADFRAIRPLVPVTFRKSLS